MSEQELAVHPWNHCHHCGSAPVTGTRFQCQSCPDGPDNDLCENCYEQYKRGSITHPAAGSLGESLNLKDHCFEAFEGKPLHLFKHWLEVTHPVATEPVLPGQFVIRPIFNAGFDAAIGGYGFAALKPGDSRPLVLTALHVMDEIIKKKGIDSHTNNKNYTGKELPAVITEVNLFDVFAANWMMAPLGSAGPMLELKEARTGHEEPYSYKDIAAFWVKPEDEKNLHPVRIAQKKPAIGEAVWLAARSDITPEKKLFKAVVVESTAQTLVFKFEDRGDKPKYSSGAPILNSQGDIAGINVGGGQLENEKLGHANHSENILYHLDSVA